MRIVTGSRLTQACEQYREAATAIRAWRKIVKHAQWRNFPELRQTFKAADYVEWKGTGYVVFSILQNRYRLVTIVRYSREQGGRIVEGYAFIRSFLTHKEYDNKNNLDKGK